MKKGIPLIVLLAILPVLYVLKKIFSAGTITDLIWLIMTGASIAGAIFCFVAKMEKKILATLITLAAIVLVSRPIYIYGIGVKTLDVSINKAERVTATDGRSSKYLVYTDKGVFEITDTWWYLQFRSSDLYGKMVGNSNKTIKTVGPRFGFLSWYPNIVYVE